MRNSPSLVSHCNGGPSGWNFPVPTEHYSANHVYCRRPGPCHLLNKRYREPTHDSKQETDYNDGFYLSHIPVPTRGKDKKRTAARRPQAGRTSIRDVVVMLNYVTKSHLLKFRVSLKAFSCFSNI